MRAIVVLLAGLLAAGCTPTATGQAGKPPDTHTGSFTIVGRAVPLPPGEWPVMGAGDVRGATPQTGITYTVGNSSTLLVQERDGKLVGLVSIAASDRGEWLRYRDWQIMACAPTNISLRSLVREGGERFQNCADVRTWTGTTQRPASMAAHWQP
jgi:hypothetical protein